MLNLKELENRLDAALANETSDSLNEWLKQQRMDSIVKYYGKGDVANLKDESICYQGISADSNKIISPTDKVSSPELFLAA